jgi:WD40 repeat protein
LGLADVRGGVHVWDAATNHWTSTVAGGEHPGPHQITLSDDGRRAATIDATRKVTIWEIGPQPRIISQTLRVDGALLIRLSAKGDRIAVSDLNGGVTLLDVASSEVLAKESTKPERVTAFAFSPDGRLLAFGTMYGQVGIFDGSSLQWYMQPADVHAMGVSGIAFNRDGSWMTSAGGNDVVLWDVSARTRLGSPFNNAGSPHVVAVAFGGSDEYIVAATHERVTRWNVDPASWKREACEVAGRNLSCAEWRRYFGTVLWRPTCVVPARKCSD